MFKNPFSFEGRIRRSEYGISIILFAFARVVLIFLLAAAFSRQEDYTNAMVFNLILSIPLLWFLWAQGSKRCHDLGNSGWFQLIPFYSLWMIFQDGVPGSNQYGENPKNNQNNLSGTNSQPFNQGNTTRSTSNSGYPGQYSGGHNSTGHNQNNQDSRNNDGYQNGSLYN